MTSKGRRKQTEGFVFFQPKVANKMGKLSKHHSCTMYETKQPILSPGSNDLC